MRSQLSYQDAGWIPGPSYRSATLTSRHAPSVRDWAPYLPSGNFAGSFPAELDRSLSMRSAAPSTYSAGFGGGGTPNWWQLSATREMAHRMLQGLPDGAFLIRRSDRQAKVRQTISR